jgi:uroporphyrinogen decarboxylase
MGKEKLNSRERVRLALEHKPTDRIPIAMLCGGINPKQEFDAFLRKECNTGLNEYIDSFLDTKELWFETGMNRGKSDTDIWGVKRKPVSYGSGTYDEIIHYPLASVQTPDDINKYAWPTTKLFDYSQFNEEIKQLNRDRERCIALSVANLFETSWYMRGLEPIFMDMMMAPEMVHAIMKNVTRFYIEHYARVLSACKGKIDLVFTADDIGGQDGLLMPLNMWEEFIKPYHVEMNAMIHEYGCKVVYHSDGAIMDAVPSLIDMGIDVLQAIQLNAKGMDAAKLKENFGDKLCFEGAMCVQKILPFGTVEEVKAETRRLVDTLGKNGGYLIGPSHYIQHGTPAENIYAFFEETKKYYPY